MNILLWLLILVCIAILAWSFLDSRRLYRFSFFFAMSFVGFALPQIIGLSNEGGTTFASILPEGAVDMLTFVAITCVLACFVGDLRATAHIGKAPILRHQDYELDRLLRVTFLLTLAPVVVFFFGVQWVTEDQMKAMGNQFTGTITIIIFFTTMQKYGLALAVLLFIRYRSPLALACVLFGVFWVGFSFFTAYRRGNTADLVFILILGLYFGRGFILPAWLVGVILAFGALWSNSIGHFRGNEDLTLMEKFESVDIVQEFNNTLTNGGHELANAAMRIWCADKENEYDFGRANWNQLVHGYFPGQIFGAELKQNLKFSERDLPLELFNYKGPVGATSTGLSDAFCSFWYLGFIKFYIIGYVMGRWWNRANRGDLRAQLAYMALMGSALHTISHGTFWLLNNYIHMVIFAYPCLWWARRPVVAPETTQIKPTAPLLLLPNLNFGG